MYPLVGDLVAAGAAVKVALPVPKTSSALVGADARRIRDVDRDCMRWDLPQSVVAVAL